MAAPQAIGGNRLHWHDLPAWLRAAIDTAAGSPVRQATNQPAGFSPGLASVLRLDDGRSVFVKAVSTRQNPDSPGLHRREAQVLAALPETVRAPRLRWCHDDGDWVALMTDAIDGRTPAQPWIPDELAAFVALAAAMAHELTPAPMAATPVQERLANAFTGWRQLAAATGLDDLDPWARRHVDRLASIEAQWPAAAAGDTLLHADLRADNVMLRDDGTAVAVDWPHVCVGAEWLDMLCALPSVAMHGGGPPETLWRAYPPARTADPDAVTTMLTAVVGYFLRQSRQPPPPGLPAVRAFQRAQGHAGLAWLRHRLDGDG